MVSEVELPSFKVTVTVFAVQWAYKVILLYIFVEEVTLFPPDLASYQPAKSYPYMDTEGSVPMAVPYVMLTGSGVGVPPFASKVTV